MRTARRCFWFPVLALISIAPLAQAQGGLRLGPPMDGAASAPHWQARFGLSTVASAAPDESGRWQTSGARLLGDYYWSGWGPARFGLSGGFRATSGLLVGERSLALGGTLGLAGPAAAGAATRYGSTGPRLGEAVAPAWSAVPYVGIGYSGISLRGGWSFTADLGLAGAYGGLGSRREGGSGLQGVDELLRELRLTPVLQFGASYAF